MPAPSGRILNILSSVVGCNTLVPPIRIKSGMDRNAPGVIELASASNVYIDDSGMVQSRPGFIKTQDGYFHSLFSNKGAAFVVKDRTEDSAIYSITVDNNNSILLEGVRSGLTRGEKMAWEEINGDTFYTNGYENGFIRNRVSFDWPTGVYVGADTDKQFSPAPIGSHLSFKSGGTIFISRDNVVFANAKPFEFGLFNLKSGFLLFETKVLMLASVLGGLFISDEKYTWFFKGTGIEDFTQLKVLDYPAVEWSLSHEAVSARDLGVDMDGYARIWAGEYGVCAGLPNGSILELTSDKIRLAGDYRCGASIVSTTFDGSNAQLISTLF